jgi:hypothetical protein
MCCILRLTSTVFKDFKRLKDEIEQKDYILVSLFNRITGTPLNPEVNSGVPEG